MKRGFTLIELLVYIAIMGFIIVVAGRVFSDATVMRVRSQNMVKAAEEVGRVGNLLSEDISQMGVKMGVRPPTTGGNLYVLDTNDNVYMEATGANPDKSSFRLTRGAKYDALTFRKTAFNANGTTAGAMEISYSVNAKEELERSCEIKSGAVDKEECPDDIVVVATNVKSFSLFPSAPGIKPSPSVAGTSNIPHDTIFPLLGTSSPNDKNFKFISGFEWTDDNFLTVGGVAAQQVILGREVYFAKNDENTANNSYKYNEIYFASYEAGTSNNVKNSCLKVPIKKGETYAVEFNMPFPVGTGTPEEARLDSSSTQFLPGQDHIAVGLRYSDGTKVLNVFSPDVLMYASQDENANTQSRYAEFFARNEPTDDVCVALTFSFYSPSVMRGKFIFSDFKIYKKQTGAYHFVKENNNYDEDFANKYATESDPDKLRHKKMVKAFELFLEIDRNYEVSGTYSKDSTGIAIPVPNNGVTFQ